MEPSPCFSNFLARTTFVLVSLPEASQASLTEVQSRKGTESGLPEAKNPGQDAFLGILSFTVVILDIIAYLVIDCDCW